MPGNVVHAGGECMYQAIIKREWVTLRGRGTVAVASNQDAALHGAYTITAHQSLQRLVVTSLINSLKEYITVALHT